MIVDEDLWRRVQGHLEENRIERREGDKALEPSLLAGIVFDASSEPMTPTHAVKKGTRYRYYISRRLITGPASDSFRGQRVPASNLEALVIGRLRALLADPVEFLNAISNGERDAPMQKRLRDAAVALSARWELLPTDTLHDLTRSILVRAQGSLASRGRLLPNRYMNSVTSYMDPARLQPDLAKADPRSRLLSGYVSNVPKQGAVQFVTCLLLRLVLRCLGGERS